ncbi:cysteine-rich CWC family protein [Bradyrhizobium sp. B097]|uniref:cysteine-rich CWC family protein n=1 Tax=Bradyrhizobium sp. B097 TaxID=3140244 RepID=UPI00318335F2
MDLTSHDRSEPASPRRLACTACGSEFSCSLTGSCWCSDESFRLPMPADSSDCLCPACLRKLAEQQAAVSAK